MVLGYIRVSTEEQELILQKDALINAGVSIENIYSDKISSSKAERPGLQSCLNILRTGDTLVVWRLDRLGRSLKELVELIENLKLKGISLKSISDGVEANAENKSSASDLVFKIFAVLAEFERNLIQERTKAGLKAARQRGRLGGRPPGPKSKQKVRLTKQLSSDNSLSIKEIINHIGISKSTYYRYIKMKNQI